MNANTLKVLNVEIKHLNGRKDALIKQYNSMLDSTISDLKTGLDYSECTEKNALNQIVNLLSLKQEINKIETCICYLDDILNYDAKQGDN